ncbi:S9 family peptidase [Mangrovivirga cuniculi]|uniref:S9 family peptidase n=1 Tax=Mangrovivirga cuniculi TaxID=2715131 RepID=A0A4D7K138_9BACT|nr:prolyl oligopeptidase family serine peptidase [Mangrovivirga cuniculi]QCK16645.1 S9 family peptidase [Mangrovivirga cuniculi]
MKFRLTYFLLPVILTFSCGQETEEKETTNTESAPELYTIEQFESNTLYNGGYFSKDESKLLVSSNVTGIYNIYEINIADQSKEQITNSTEESIFVEGYVPGTNDIIYSADKGGDELDHLYLLSRDGSTTELTTGEKEKANFYRWSEDEKSMIYGSNKRDPKYFDVYKMEIGKWEPEMIYKNEDGYFFEGISHNEKYMVLAKPITTSENELYLLNTENGKMTEISKNKGSYRSSGFSNDDKHFFYRTDDGKEFMYLKKYNIETGEEEVVYETNWDVSYSYLSKNDKYRVTGINEDGKISLVVTNNETDEKVDFPDFEDGSVRYVRISDSENKMMMPVGSSKSPSDLYVYNIENEELTKLTNSLNDEIDASDLVSAEVIRYKSFDGTEIPAIYYKPKVATEDNKVPALVWVHGGPGGQSRVGYFSLIQYLVNHGYAILAVNNRGSSGYGKTFYKMDDKNHGDKDLKDCIWGKKWLADKSYIDADRIGIIGGSYGGYMTMAAMTFAPEEFDVGVNIFGVTNWLRTLKSIPPYWEAQREALYTELGDPFSEDSVRLREISPLFHAENVKNPIMVLQGANDPRVLQVESDEIVEEVRKNGVPVEYVLFEDEGHGFVKKENKIEGYGKILDFLNTYLKGDGAKVENEPEQMKAEG